MTEVTPETPMKIQEEEIKVQDGFEHLIKIYDISEQNVNNMKEWMALQGLEDILQILGALNRDPDGRMDKYEPYISTEGNQTFLPRHVASNLSPLSHWDREFTSNHQMPTPMVVTMTQGLSDVCDPNFKPKRGDHHDQQRFTEKQNFVYAVLLKTHQTDYGRALVREHEHDKEAQQILYELHQQHTDSELSRAEVLWLTTYVPNLKLTDNWRGTTTQFLLHFKEQLRLLDSLVPLDEQLPDSTRMVFLQRAVKGVPDLRRVRILDGVMTAKSGSFTTITYEGYYKLLQDSSFHHDKALSEASRRHQIKAHEVFTEPSQETHDYHHSPQDDPQPTVEEDTLVETYKVHMSNFKCKDNPSRVFMPESSGRNSPQAHH